MAKGFLSFDFDTTPPANTILASICDPIAGRFGEMFSARRYCPKIKRLTIVLICCAEEGILPRRERTHIDLKKERAEVQVKVDFLRLTNGSRAEQAKLFLRAVRHAVTRFQAKVASFDEETFFGDWLAAVAEPPILTPDPPSPAANPFDARTLFLCRACPSYIGGEAVEESRILYRLLGEIEELSDEDARISAFQARLKDAFPVQSTPPVWLTVPEWPLGEGKLPMRFLAQRREFGAEDGNLYVYFSFEDVTTKENHTVMQWL